MKKLTKTLSLVLVVAMVLGLCVIGAGASYSSFTDKDKITKDYSEAVEIMTDLGCVSGMSATTFAPAGNFTRAQAAVILTRLTLGSSADAYVPSKVTFKDVPTSFWGYRYIEYAVQSGYVAGTGNGNYSPNATLTGYQWAAMLLKVLNITVPTTGTDWQINTAKAYYGADAFSSVAISAAAITREAATQMAYDALFAPSNGKTGYPVYDGNGTMVGVYDSIADAALVAKTLSGTYGTTKTSMGTSTLAYTVFGVTKGSGHDMFGTPSAKYAVTAYSAKKNATVAASYGWDKSTAAKLIANDATFTFTAATTAATMEKTLKGYTAVDNSVPAKTIDVNTAATATYTKLLTENGADMDVQTTSVKLADTLASLTGNGVVVKVYATGSVITDVVVLKYTFEKISSTTTKATSTVGGYTTWTTATASGKIFSSVVDADADVNTCELVGTIAKGDMVLTLPIAVTGGTYTFFYAPTTVTGTVTAVTSTGVATIGGKTYARSAATGNSAIALSSKDGTYYVDLYGYYVGTKAATSTTSYGYVISVDTYSTLTDGKVVPAYSAVLALPDGTVSTIAIDSASWGAYKDEFNGTAASLTGTNPTVTYSDKDGDGEYTLAAFSDADRYQALTAIANKSTTLTPSTGTVKYANADTLFVFVDYKTNSKNARVTAGTVTTVKGIANVGNYTTAAYALDVSTTADHIADVVFVNADTKATVADNYVYLLGTYTDTAAGRVWDTIVKGAASTLTTSTSVGLGQTVTATTLVANTLYSKIATSSDSKIDAATTTIATSNEASVKYVGGLLVATSGAYSVASDLPVYTIDLTAKTCTTGAVSDLTDAVTTGTICVVYSSGVPTAIYLAK